MPIMKGHKMKITNPTSLEKRLKNINYSAFTEPYAIRNIITKIVLMPFSDFMFFHQREYLFIMTEFTNNKQDSDFPDVLTGQIFEYIVREVGDQISLVYEVAGEERITAMLNAIYKPFLDMYDKASGKTSDPFSMRDSYKDLIESSPWKYVRKDTLEKSSKSIPLQERIRKITKSKKYKAEEYVANAHNQLIPSEMGYPFYLLLYCATFKDYYACLQSLSSTKISTTKITYSKLAQSHTGYHVNQTILEYYVKQNRGRFNNNIYSLFIHPMAQISRTMYMNYCRRTKKGNH